MMVREKLAEAKFIATCTDYNRHYLADLGKDVFDHKLKLVYHGLDAGRYRRREVSAAPKPVILSVGQLRERKGYPYLIEACRILREQGFDFECRIVGEGPLYEELDNQIQDLGLENHVLLYGALPEEEVINQYEQATIFTLPAILGKDGDRDGIPNVILEAMAMEIPVVSTDHSGIPEVVEDHVNGLLVPPGDPDTLAQALSRLLRSPDLRKRMGQKGRQTVLAKFDPHKNARLLLDAFIK